MTQMPTNLEAWLADEAAVRARIDAGVGPGVNDPATLIDVSGLELMQAMLRGERPTPPIAHTLDFLIVEVTRGRAIFQGTPKHEHLNPLGTVHGGWFCTLLDSALGCAVHTTLPAGMGYTTLELKVNMLRPLTDAVPLVRAEGKVIHAGRQVATAEGRIVGPDGRLYAHATTTCMIFDHSGK